MCGVACPPDARSPPPAYAAAMGNSFGIALNPAWTEWAAKQGVSESIAAALYLLSEINSRFLRQ
jgi:hypothetical protein